MYKHRFGKIKKCIQTPNLTKTSIITPSKKFNQTPNSAKTSIHSTTTVCQKFIYTHTNI